MRIGIALLIMAVATYLTRVIPITFFNKRIESVYIRSFLHYVPYAVLGAMTFPHIFYATDNSLYATIGTVIAILLGYAEKSLVTVAVAAVGAIYICNLWL